MDARFVSMRPAGCSQAAGAHCSDGWEVVSPWHYHDMHQLLYAFDGSVEIEGYGGRYKVPRQFAVWIPAGAIHRTTIQKVASGSVFLNSDMVASTLDQPRVIAAPPLLREMVMHAMRWPLGGEASAASQAYFTCFAHLCEDWISEEVALILPASDARGMAAIIEHMRTHIAQVSIGDICSRFNMTERTLRRHFRQAVGISWEDYRRRLRLFIALEAIEQTRRPIGQIAADVGYENQAAFARAFRRALGMGPSEYRRKGSVRA